LKAQPSEVDIMGLDIALGGLLLLMAIRGWFKGFLLQAIRLGGLILCVYAADPVRDQIKPYVVEHLAKIRPDLVDRMLWWTSAVATYIVLVGIATLAIKLYRKQPYGMDEPRRGDQFAGSLLGIAKATLVAAVLLAAIQKYGMVQIKSVPWALEQVNTSMSVDLCARYQPVPRIWASTPVQHFVQHIQKMGWNRPESVIEPEPELQAQAETTTEPKVGPVATHPLPQATSPVPQLQLGSSKAVTNREDVDPEVVEAVRDIERELARTGR